MKHMLENFGWWLVERFGDIAQDQTHADYENVIETWARDEYRQGRSAGAAARQLCRSLGASGCAPTLKTMLEEMLADANRASFDRSQILDEFCRHDPRAGHAARMTSFRRINDIAA